MSKKGKKSKSDKISKSQDSSAIEIGYLTGAILDYYESTGYEPLDSGEEWKDLDPEKYRAKGIEVPADLDEEIKKAFMAQIKKLQ